MKKLLALTTLISSLTLASNRDPEVVTLKFRSYSVKVSSTSYGAKYAVMDNNGHPLYADFTREEFQVKAPTVFKLYEDAIAEEASLDASANVKGN